MKTKKDSSHIMISIGFIIIAFLIFLVADCIGGIWTSVILLVIFIIYRIVKSIRSYDPSKYDWHCANCGKIVPAKEVDSDGVHIDCGYDCDYGIYIKNK